MAFTKNLTRVPLSFRRPKSRREQIRRRRARSTRYYSTFFCGRRNDDYAPYAFITKKATRAASLSPSPRDARPGVFPREREPAAACLARVRGRMRLPIGGVRLQRGAVGVVRGGEPRLLEPRHGELRRGGAQRARLPPAAGSAANAHSRTRAAASQDEWSLRRSATNASPVRCAAATAAGEVTAAAARAAPPDPTRANRARDARNDASASRNAAAPRRRTSGES